MHVAMSNALALTHWHDLGFLRGDFTGSNFAWSLIGVLLAVVVIYVLAAEAALALNAPPRLQSRARLPAAWVCSQLPTSAVTPDLPLRNPSLRGWLIRTSPRSAAIPEPPVKTG
jgi:hypothetical protein